MGRLLGNEEMNIGPVGVRKKERVGHFHKNGPKIWPTLDRKKVQKGGSCKKREGL